MPRRKLAPLNIQDKHPQKKQKVASPSCEEINEADLFSLLSNEILLQFFSYLTFKDVAVFSSTDHRFNLLVKSNDIWKPLCVDRGWPLPTKVKKITYKEWFYQRYTKKKVCHHCGLKTTSKRRFCPKCIEKYSLHKNRAMDNYKLEPSDLEHLSVSTLTTGMWGSTTAYYEKSELEVVALKKWGKEEFEKLKSNL